MASADELAATEPDAGAPRGRIRHIFSSSRALIRLVYREPEHIPERLTLYSIDRLAEPSAEWAESARRAEPGRPRAELADQLRTQSAQIARIDGAISGTPFFIALVPGYLTYLWQEMRMTLRTAALYGRDPRQLETAAEMLALRQVHPDVETARKALIAVRDTPMPDKPAKRRSLREWVHSVYVLLVFGGFLSPSAAKEQTGAMARIKTILSVVLGIVLWVMTWVFPLTFMVMMAWGCETHARQLGRRALIFYDGEEATVSAAVASADRRRDRGHDKRAILRATVLFLSIVIPIVFITYANHVRKTTGINWLAALGAVVALSLVIATAVISSRR